MSSLQQGELFKILEEELITPVYQPIVDLQTGSVLGYEALSRGPANSLLHSPENLFSTAAACGQLLKLDSLCRKKAIQQAHALLPQQYLFLNVDPQILYDKNFHQGTTKKFLETTPLNSQHIIFEITEKRSIDDYANFRAVLDNYQQQGYSIAIDDVGSGYSGLTLLTKISPQFLKIDIELIRAIQENTIKQSIVKSLIDIAAIKSMQLIAEGIETEAELDCLAALGVPYGQGYFLGRPSTHLNDIAPERIAQLKKKPSAEKKTVIMYSAIRPLPTLPKEN